MATYDPERLLRALRDHAVEFVVIGQTAAALQGAPAMTQDLDITHEAGVDNVERLVEALLTIAARRIPDASGGHEGAPPDERELLGQQPVRYTTEFGVLDVVPVVRGVGGYDRLRQRAVVVDLEGVQVVVASLDDVIASKEALGRPKDRAQLPALYATRRAREQQASGS